MRLQPRMRLLVASETKSLAAKSGGASAEKSPRVSPCANSCATERLRATSPLFVSTPSRLDELASLARQSFGPQNVVVDSAIRQCCTFIQAPSM